MDCCLDFETVTVQVWGVRHHSQYMKPMTCFASLVISLALMSSGCASLRPSAEVPEWEQANENHREQTDTATLKAEDSFWQFLSIPLWLAGEAVGGAVPK